MKKIKLIHIITKLELGGAQRNTLYTVKKISQDENFDVVLVSGKGGILDNEASEIPTVKFIPLTYLVREINPLKDLAALFEILAVLIKEKPDIIHTHSSKAGILGRLAGAFYNFLSPGQKTKIIHTYHGFGFTPQQNPIIRRIFVLLEKITSAFSDKLIFVSEANRQTAVSLKFADHTRHITIRSGVDLNFFKNFNLSDAEKLQIKSKYNILPDEKVVLTIGPFKKQKNLADFIKVASEIKRRSIKAKFIIVGDGESKKELETLAEELGVKKEIIFAGWITSKKDLAALLKISNVFLMTSLWEGLPRSMIEAIASGVPVCANAVDGIQDIITDGITGLLSAPFDIKKSADNVEKILRDTVFAVQLSTAASKKVDDDFDIDKMVERQKKMYFDLL